MNRRVESGSHSFSLPARSAVITASTAVAGALWLVAIAAVDRAVFAGLERNLGLVATACAGSCIHLALAALLEAAATTTIATLSFTC